MAQLRNKVYRRVKTKMLNGKSLSSHMFLQLCYSYTESINKGNVPCIDSAWVSLCKMENLKAVQEAIR